jgi:heparan-alpha-glucosaminide N-acetyltransferase
MKVSMRIPSIDVFRALTMFFMIFVNDVDGVKNIPQWIKHVGMDESGLGFADVIFPAFLFIVGLSMPLALQRKISQGASPWALFQHISIRAFALIVMGLFHVNFSYFNAELVGISRSLYIVLCTISFFLVWLDYSKQVAKKWQIGLQIIGWLALIGLAAVFKSGTLEEISWMKFHWWGILGLIGWSYWFIGLGYLITKGNILAFLTYFILLILINFGVHLDLFSLPDLVIGDTAHAVLVGAGVLTTLYYMRHRAFTIPTLCLHFIIAAVVFLIIGGFAAQYIDGINKIRATPGWVHLCIGISLCVYAASVYFIDLKNKSSYFKWISAAGTNTLTCYLLPYIWYAALRMAGFQWPAFFNEGIGGILRSFLVAFAIVKIAEWLGKKSIRIKV